MRVRGGTGLLGAFAGDGAVHSRGCGGGGRRRRRNGLHAEPALEPAVALIGLGARIEGADNTGACTPNNLVRRFRFPLRGFISPVKNQGNRGTCWAFTAIAAVESRERVKNDNAVDLSEQLLVNKVKLEWMSNDFRDGLSSAAAPSGSVRRRGDTWARSRWRIRALHRHRGRTQVDRRAGGRSPALHFDARAAAPGRRFAAFAACSLRVLRPAPSVRLGRRAHG